MAGESRYRPFSAGLLAAAASAILAASNLSSPASGDTIVLKNGTVLRGTLDHDNTLAFVSDNLKRTIFYNSKIAKVESDTGFSRPSGSRSSSRWKSTSASSLR